MTIVLVTHSTEAPAVDGMIAGMIAADRDAPLVTLVTGGAGLARFDCNLHVLAHGELAPNGVFWAEWASGRSVEPPVQAPLVARHLAPTVVVSINPAIQAQAKAAERIAVHAMAAARAVEVLDVRDEDGIFVVSSVGGEPVARWRRDPFGRPVRADTVEAAIPGDPVRLLVVGDERLLRDTYPANLAAIGDAANALGVDVELSFFDPREADEPKPESLVSGIDGIVLPGGSDMEQVPGQINLAQVALRRDIPTVGLCLGMQTMATAVAREIGGCNDANMAEADPDAQTKTFVRLKDEDGRPEFRLGLRQVRVAPGSKLSAIFGGSSAVPVHCNHRFVLDPALHAMLSRAGMSISAFQQGRDLADAIEMPAMRFYVGMQGHPELSTRRGAPNPLVLAFLRAASGR